MKRLVAAFGALALALALACSDPLAPGPNQIQVTPLFVSLAVGATAQLTVSVLDADGHQLASAPVTYSSSDTTIAKVSATGLVSGVGAGITQITIRSDPASASIVANVSSAASLQLLPKPVLLTGTQTGQLIAVARDASGAILPAAPVTYGSRDSSIVTVSATGLVTPHGVGTTYVTASSGTASDSTMVTALVARVMISGTPVGAAAVSTSAAYTTLDAANSVARLSLTTPGVTSTVGVGLLPTSITINHAGTLAYVGNQNGHSVSVISTVTDAVVGTVQISGSALAVYVAPGDSLLLVGTDAGRLYVVRLSSLAVVDSMPVPSYTNSLAMRGDTTVFANAMSTSAVVELNLRTRQVVRTLNVGGTPQGMVVSQSGTELYLANEIGQLQIWNLTTGTLSGSVALTGGGGFGLAVQPTTGLLYVSTSYIGQCVHVIDVGTRKVVRVIVTGGTARRIAFAPDGSVGIVANEGGWVDFIR